MQRSGCGRVSRRRPVPAGVAGLYAGRGTTPRTPDRTTEPGSRGVVAALAAGSPASSWAYQAAMPSPPTASGTVTVPRAVTVPSGWTANAVTSPVAPDWT